MPFLFALGVALAGVAAGTWSVARWGGGPSDWRAVGVALLVVIVPVMLGGRWSVSGLPRTLLVAVAWPCGIGAAAWIGYLPRRPDASKIAAPRTIGPDTPPASPPDAPATPGPPTASHRLPFEIHGNAIVVPVTFFGADGARHDLPMLFDTGASKTTLNEATLRELGFPVLPNAPVLDFQTAGGSRPGPIVIIDGLEVAGTEVGPITVSQCEPCADENTRGLLGLNVTGRFLITLDLEGRTLTLEPRLRSTTATAQDVVPWLTATADGTVDAGVLAIDVTVSNVARLDARDVEVGVTCGTNSGTVSIPVVPAGGVASGSGRVPVGTGCGTFQYSVSGGRLADPAG